MMEATSVGTLLRRHRDLAALSQEELAERAGISARSVSDIERGLSRTPQQTTMRRLADALALGDDDRARFLSASRGATRSATSPLVVASTPLLGRAREEAAALHLLRFESVRLLTLTGPGGVGKTRLAQSLAETLATDFAEARFVSLAALTDAALVPAAIASALGLRESGETSTEEALLSRLGDTQTLLILDNLEHVLPAALLLARLLAACPGLRMLVTSRARLRLKGEHELDVPPLALPDLRRLPGPDSLAGFPSVALFCARARAARADFRLTEANAPVVAEICVRLDGLPLALELAAARIRALSPQALLVRLNRRLPILTGGPADAPPRQQTMRDAILWSHDLLTREERQLFRQLAVFVGGASLEAIEEIVPDGETVLDPIEALSGASMVGMAEIDGGEETRFTMFETIRELALEKLAEHPREEDELRRRHAAFYLRIAQESEDAVVGPEQGHWFAVMEREHANLRAALDWCESSGQTELALRIGAPLWRFWGTCGHAREGLSRLSRLLQRADDAVPTDVRAVALYASGALEYFRGDFPRARDFWDQCLSLQREIGDEWRIADTLNGLGIVATEMGHLEEAGPRLTESASLRRQVGDERGLCATLNNLANVARYSGQLRQAVALYEDVIAGYQKLDAPAGAALLNLGLIYHDLGEHVRASTVLEEGLAEAQLLGDTVNEAMAIVTLGAVAIDTGNPARGKSYSHTAASLYRTMGEDSALGLALLNEGIAAAMLGEIDSARLCMAESLRLVRLSGQRRLELQVLLGIAYLHLQSGMLEAARSCTEEAYAMALDVGWPPGLAEAQGRRARIARLLGSHLDCVRFHAEATAIRQLLETPLQPAYRQEYETDLRISREEMDAESFSLTWEEGRRRGMAVVEPRLSVVRIPTLSTPDRHDVAPTTVAT